MGSNTIGIAIVGCGYVADYYMATINCYSNVHLVGVYDKSQDRLKAFSNHYKIKMYQSLDDMLSDASVTIVLNLTNPRSHYEISLQCLSKGKHVYSEKPLAMSFDEAESLVSFAKSKALKIVSAPCSVLGKAAKTLSYAVRSKVAGSPRLVYAELDDGLVHKMAYKQWISQSGAPWPYRDEFETGCTLEHAGYYLAWLMEMFGPVEVVVAYSDVLIENKVSDESPLDIDAPDISIGVLKFKSGMVARLSTTIVAPHDHSIRVVCDDGILSLNECWDNVSSVFFRKLYKIRRKTFLAPWKKLIKLPEPVVVNKMNRGNTKMDFMLGVSALADSIEGNSKNNVFVDPDFSLHVNEVALALHEAGDGGLVYQPKSSFQV